MVFVTSRTEIGRRVYCEGYSSAGDHVAVAQPVHSSGSQPEKATNATAVFRTGVSPGEIRKARLSRPNS